MSRGLPIVSARCVTCGSEDVRTISRSHATGEVLMLCECGEQYWEADLSSPQNPRYDEKAA
jgi:hypothetical protein